MKLMRECFLALEISSFHGWVAILVVASNYFGDPISYQSGLISPPLIFIFSTEKIPEKGLGGNLLCLALFNMAQECLGTQFVPPLTLTNLREYRKT